MSKDFRFNKKEFDFEDEAVAEDLDDKKRRIKKQSVAKKKLAFTRDSLKKIPS